MTYLSGTSSSILARRLRDHGFLPLWDFVSLHFWGIQKDWLQRVLNHNGTIAGSIDFLLMTYCMELEMIIIDIGSYKSILDL